MPLRYLPTTVRAAKFHQHLRSRFVRNAPGYAKRSNVITSTLVFSPSARRLWLNKTIWSELQWNRPQNSLDSKQTENFSESSELRQCYLQCCFIFAQNSVSFCHTVSKTISALWWCIWWFERERYVNDVFKKALKSCWSLLLFNLLFHKPFFLCLF